MEGYARYRHLHVDWVGELATESITLCGGANEDSGTEQTLCPNCAQVRDALNVCGLGPESLRELFDMLRVIDPSEVKAKMEADTHTPSETEQVTMPRWSFLPLIKPGKITVARREFSVSLITRHSLPAGLLFSPSQPPSEHIPSKTHLYPPFLPTSLTVYE